MTVIKSDTVKAIEQNVKVLTKSLVAKVFLGRSSELTMCLIAADTLWLNT